MKCRHLAAVALSLFAICHAAAARAQNEGGMSVAGWGAIFDRDGDCDVRADMDKLTITVPKTFHNLNPTRGMNAPRVLRKVSGNFQVQVKVTGDFKPGSESTGVGRPFNGAGLLVWASEKNFLRVERNAWWAGAEALYCYPPLMEYWREGEYSGANDDPRSAEYFQGRSTWLKLRRQGAKMTVSLSHDGMEWSEIKTFAVDMPEDVMVGVAALNSSNEPFTAEFEGMEIALK